ncbi:MAG: tRNA (adenosine(37)-N6)-threonylcarbamoyltransferase complex dimerization subunit type 1 TsaB [Acutalibacteraceae bacterium]
MMILAVDSSAINASAAVCEDSKIIASSCINTSLTHSQTLLAMIEAMLKNARISISDIDAFAVNAGPGSFTGVRIGIAAVKGLAFGTDKPCVSVSTLDCIAALAAYPFGRYKIEAVMDARCNQVYNAQYLADNGKITKISEDRAIKICELADEIQNSDIPVIFAGDGADLCYNNFSENNNVFITRPADRYQRAENTALIAESLFKEGKTSSPADLEVNYLRMPQAEREYAKKSKQE